MSDASVELRDQLSIDTPELVALEFPLAGVGSRSIACVLDYTIQAAAYLLFLLGIVLLGSMLDTDHPATKAAQVPSPETSEVWAMAILFILLFLLHWGYFSLFEAFWNGQTPGKRIMKLRVIQQTGRQIGFFDALARNLLRVVDLLPGLYFVGILSAFLSKRSQRLGDLVAGTIVIHERTVETPIWEGGAARSLTAFLVEAPSSPAVTPPTGLPAHLIARLNRGDLEMIEGFNARRLELPYDTSQALAARLAQQIALKLGTPAPQHLSPETFLERLASEMRSLGTS